MIAKLVAVILCCISLEEVRGHGMLLDPPNRSSLWRFDDSAPKNYDDNQNFCGGFSVQYYENNGKCGLCGDNYTDPQPRANENTGIYGQGKIVAYYQSGTEIEVFTLITANHLGHLSFDICKLENENEPEPGEECFEPLKFADGSDKFQLKSTDSEIVNTLVLPESLACDHCVLRWTYTTGNNWGYCDDGTSGVGCGIQEMFKTCSDVRIRTKYS